MTELTGYHLRALDLQRELVDHGWGEMVFKVTSKDNITKVEISCGKGFVYFIKKDLKFDINKIL